MIPDAYASTGLTLPDGLEFDDWVTIGTQIQRAADASMWWLGDWWNFGERAYGEQAAAAIEMGEKYQTFADAAYVARAVEFSRRLESLTWSFHREVAPLDPAAQDAILATAAEQGLTIRETRALVRETQRPSIQGTPDMPPGLYGVILADPPWQYEHPVTESRAIENQYPTMTLEQICSLEVPAADDCVLFLWSTSPKLYDAFHVLEAWEFAYRTCLVWVKDKIGMGYYARQRHELLLVATRGDPRVPEPGKRPDSVIEAPRGEHSVKPDIVHRMIETMYPDVPRIELFSRRDVPDWDRWGATVE